MQHLSVQRTTAVLEGDGEVRDCTHAPYHRLLLAVVFPHAVSAINSISEYLHSFAHTDLRVVYGQG